MPRRISRRRRKLIPRIPLTQKEEEEKIIELFSKGYTYPEVAAEMHEHKQA
jgi:DNA-binding CsgD family transcriptional regulator